MGQSIDQGVSQTISLAQGVGKGIGIALGNLFSGGDPGRGQSIGSIGLKSPGKPTLPKSGPLYFKGG